MKTLFRFIIVIIVSVPFLVSSCKKKQPAPSSEKGILYMSFTDGHSRYYDGIVKYDTVLVKIPKGMKKDSLHVDYKIMGAKISPLPGSVTDFTHPVVFTVTAEDGSSRQYTVVVEYQASEKEITGFRFKAADNPGLTEDVTGTIDNNDTIRVRLPAGPDLSALRPTISFVGADVSPGSGVATDFTRPVTYYVSAEDHSGRSYIVMVTQDIFASAADGMVYIGSTDGYVYALDFVTGGVIWKFFTGYAVSDPIYFDSTVYFGSNNTVYALNATTGAVKWQFVDKPVSFNTPCVAGGVVYLSYNSDNGDGIYALDANSGNLVWQRTFGNTDPHSPVAFADGRVYISGWYGDIQAFDASTGANLWVYYGGGLTAITPAIANGMLYAGDEARNLIALDSKTGEKKWEIGGMNYLSSPTVLNGVVYFGAGYVEAADANTGALIWKSDFYSGNQLTAPVISDNVLFIEDARNVYAVNIKDGTLIWKYIYAVKLTNSTSAPTVADNRLICNNDGHGIYALSASTGKLQWTFTAEGLIYTNPCIVDSAGNAFYSGRAGNVN